MGRKISIENGIENIRTPKIDWSKIPIDTKVIVTSTLDSKEKYNRHFAGVNKEGKPMVFSLGKTSFTSTNGLTEYWNKIELYKEEEEELLNMDVVCVKGGFGFNLATIYAVKNGIIEDCDYKFKSLEELNSYFIAKFAKSEIPAGLREERDIADKYRGYPTINPSKLKPSIYNDVVVCIKRPESMERYFTIGKVYKIINGWIFSDIGLRGLMDFSDIEDLNKAFINSNIEFSTVNNKTFVCVKIPSKKDSHFTIGKTYKIIDGMISNNIPQCGIFVDEMKDFSECFKEKIYNATVICTKISPSLARYFTIGNIYDIKNGKIHNNKGIFTDIIINSIEELNNYFKDTEFSEVLQHNQSINCFEELSQPNTDFICKEIFWDGVINLSNLIIGKYRAWLDINEQEVDIKIREEDNNGVYSGLKITTYKKTKEEIIKIINDNLLNRYNIKLVLFKNYNLSLSVRKNFTAIEIVKLKEMGVEVEEIK